MVLNILASIACHVYRIIHLRIATGFPLGRYVVRSMVPVVMVSLLCTVLAVKLPLVGCLACPVAVVVLGVSGQERRFVLSAVRKRLGR